MSGDPNNVKITLVSTPETDRLMVTASVDRAGLDELFRRLEIIRSMMTDGGPEGAEDTQ